MNLLRTVLAIFIFCSGAQLSVQQAGAFEVEDYTMLTAEDGGALDQYGFCMDTDGRWLVVGAKNATVDGLQSGAVYVYRKKGNDANWKFVQKLVPENENGISPVEFGESVAVARNRILVGARSMVNTNGQQAGTAFLYTYGGQRRGWVLETEIEPSEGNDGDEFGRSVALGPNRLFVGARFANNDGGERSGAVYVYHKHRRNWELEVKLTDPNGGEGDQFGRAMSFDEKNFRYLVVGSRKASDGVGDRGKVIIFKLMGRSWRLVQEIEAYDGTETDYFGQSVVLSGDILVVGSRDSVNAEGEGVGAAYIYRLARGQKKWVAEEKLMPEDGHDKGQFGFAVDLDRYTGSSLAVSARRMDSAAGKKTGQVYLYSYDESNRVWFLDDIVAPDTSKKDDEFGQSLAMDPFGGSWLVVGADQTALDGEEKAGSAYVLRSR